MLSGFCLYLPVLRRARGGPPRVELGAFARARVFRIVPAYYASLGLLWAASLTDAGRWAVFDPILPWDVVVHALFVHNLLPASIWSINGVYWTLGLEAQLYVVFPLLVAAARRVGIARVAAGLLALAVAWPAAVHALVPDSDLPGGAWAVVYAGLPARLSEFGAGMAAAALVTRGVPPWARRAAPALALVWLPASYAVEILKVPFPIDKPLNALSFAALVVTMVGWETPRPGLLTRAMAHVGEVSFSLYLIHQPLILVLRPYLFAQRWSHGAIWALAVGVGMPALVLLSTAYHRLFEAPFLPGGWARSRP